MHFPWALGKFHLHCFTLLYCLKNAFPVLPIQFHLLPAGSMWSKCSLLLLYFEIYAFKSISQLLSPVWPILQLHHSVVLSSQLRIILYRENKGIVKQSLCCLSVASVNQYTSTFLLGEQESDLRKVERQNCAGHQSLRLQWTSAVAKASGGGLQRCNKAVVHHAVHHSRGEPEVSPGKLLCL